MSVGSAFDAFVKSYLHQALFGHCNGGYERDEIFEKQVEPHNRDWALGAGSHVFKCYKDCGALADLMFELGTAVNQPRFEFDLLGELDTEIGGVPLMGKPDIYFINSEGARVILDWKVNGYCTARTTSPMPGYIKIRDCWSPSEKKASAGNRLPHKDCFPVKFKGLPINTVALLENHNEEWASQLSIYSWLLGEEVGSQDLITGIDQIVGPAAYMRVASHRLRVGAAYQFDLKIKATEAWAAITSGHIFPELSREESNERCASLEEQAAALADSSDPMAEFINRLRKQ